MEWKTRCLSEGDLPIELSKAAKDGEGIMKTALIAGASGLVGGELLQKLLQAPEYDEVVVLVRTPLPIDHPKLQQRIIDFDLLSEHKADFSADDIFCCLGTTIKKAKTKEAFQKVDYEYPLQMAKLAKQGGAEKFLVITAMGANAHSSIFYNRVKGQLEQAIQQLNLTSLFIFRPSLLVGERSEFRLGEKLASVLTRPLIPFFIGPLRKYRPILAEQVAAAMYFAAQTETNGIYIYSSNQLLQIKG